MNFTGTSASSDLSDLLGLGDGDADRARGEHRQFRLWRLAVWLCRLALLPVFPNHYGREFYCPVSDSRRNNIGNRRLWNFCRISDLALTH